MLCLLYPYAGLKPSVEDRRGPGQRRGDDIPHSAGREQVLGRKVDRYLAVGAEFGGGGGVLAPWDSGLVQ